MKDDTKNQFIEWADTIQVGWWYARCCYIDLRQIENKDELIEILRELCDPDDSSYFFNGFWETEKEALLELRDDFHEVDGTYIKEIETRLEELEKEPMTPNTSTNAHDELPKELKEWLQAIETATSDMNTEEWEAVNQEIRGKISELQSQQDRILQMVEEELLASEPMIGYADMDPELQDFTDRTAFQRNKLRAEQRLKLAQIKEALK